MTNLFNFLLFQVGWFGCVLGAVRGEMWWGPIAVGGIVLIHLGFISRRGQRKQELAYIAAIGTTGAVLDSGLHALGVTVYPTSAEGVMAPPWIAALWYLFATLPYHSLSWLNGRTALAVALGAIGGPLSYLGGARMGAVALAEPPAWTIVGLSLEYALVTPLMLRLAHWRSRDA